MQPKSQKIVVEVVNKKNDTSHPALVLEKGRAPEIHYLAQRGGIIAGAPPAHGGSPQVPDAV